jgi:hypothetical protein
MRCSVCLSQYAGPLGICTDCLTIAFPHGNSAWMIADHQARLHKTPATSMDLEEASKLPTG